MAMRVGSSTPRASHGSPAASGGRPVPHRHVDRFNPEVKVMQRRMKAAGIDPGPIDGKKGPLTRDAMARYHARFGKSAAGDLGVDPSYAELPHGGAPRKGPSRTADSATVRQGEPSALGLPGNAGASGAPVAGRALDAGATMDGHTLPDTSGKATTFWNGNYTYRGKRDTANMSIGAWGDLNKPTDYFAAIPVGLSGGGKWWHNKKLLVTNPQNGMQVVVPVQDKGPHPSTGAKIDLSPVAKEALGVGFMDNLNVKISFAPDDAPIGPVR